MGKIDVIYLHKRIFILAYLNGKLRFETKTSQTFYSLLEHLLS